MHNLMHYEVVREASRDRHERLIGEADAYRLTRVTRGSAPARRYRPAIAELFARARAVRRPAHVRA